MRSRLIAAGVLLGLASGVLGTVGPAGGQPLPAVLNQPASHSPRAQHALLLSVAIAGQRLVAVGERGIVLLSDDHGRSWRQAAKVPVSVTLTAVRFGSATEGWAVGHLGAILHSTDGGDTWERQLDGQGAARAMRAAAEQLPPGEAQTMALHNAEQLVADGPDKPFLDLLVSANEVLAVGAYGLAVRSADGGRTWQAATEIVDPQAVHLYGIARAGDTMVIVGEQGLLMLGRSGQFRSVQTAHTGTLFGVTSVPGSVLAFGLGGALLRSDDAGATWTALTSGQTGGITSAVTLPDGRVLIGSDSGELALSDASGRTFHPTPLSPHIPITDMVVDGDALVLTGPGGPRRVALSTLDAAS